jgi:hypothetical protein
MTKNPPPFIIFVGGHPSLLRGGAYDIYDYANSLGNAMHAANRHMITPQSWPDFSRWAHVYDTASRQVLYHLTFSPDGKIVEQFPAFICGPTQEEKDTQS